MDCRVKPGNDNLRRRFVKQTSGSFARDATSSLHQNAKASRGKAKVFRRPKTRT